MGVGTALRRLNDVWKRLFAKCIDLISPQAKSVNKT